MHSSDSNYAVGLYFHASQHETYYTVQCPPSSEYLYSGRNVCGVTRRDQRRNVDIVNRLAIDRDIVELLQIRRLTYFGHVSRMQPERYPHILLHGHIAGSRPQGRPRKKWIDNIKEDCSFLGITPIDATRFTQDRSQWRILVHSLGCQRAGTQSSSPRH